MFARLDVIDWTDHEAETMLDKDMILVDDQEMLWESCGYRGSAELRDSFDVQ
jgi:hypothetical protein